MQTECGSSEAIGKGASFNSSVQIVKSDTIITLKCNCR
jgi:hypothetical protein